MGMLDLFKNKTNSKQVTEEFELQGNVSVAIRSDEEMTSIDN